MEQQGEESTDTSNSYRPDNNYLDTRINDNTDQSRGFISDIILNAVEPGVNYSVLLFLNIVFILLLLIPVMMSVLTGFNIHLLIFGVLTVMLMIGFNV